MILTVSPDKVHIVSSAVDSLGEEPRLYVLFVNHAEFRYKGGIVLLFS